MRTFSWNMAIFIWQREDHPSGEAFITVWNMAQNLPPPDNMITAVEQLRRLYELAMMEELL